MNRSRSNESRKGGTPGKTPNRQGLYSKAAKHAENAIEILVYLMEKSNNDTVRVSAAKAILDKCLPDLRATDLDVKETGPVIVRIVSGYGYIPPSVKEDIANGKIEATGERYVFGEKQVE